MSHAVIGRFRALDAAFRRRAGRQERLAARFAALAALHADSDIESLIEATFETRRRLHEGLGGWRAPARPMRLVFAAALVATDRRPEDFFTARKALMDVRRRRGGRVLSQGGSCAAFALIAAGGQPDHAPALADDMFDILEAVAAPWWRREPSREEVFAARSAALGEHPEEAAARLIRARDVLIAAGAPRKAAEAASYEIGLMDFDAGATASSWTVLNTAVRGRNGLQAALGKTGLAVLAAQGDGTKAADALTDAFDAVSELRPRSGSAAAARLALRLAQAELGAGQALSAAEDLSAVLAAQNAVIAGAAAGGGVAVAAS